MEYDRTLDLTLLSATELKNAGKSNVYAVASISDSSKVQKFKTPVHKDGGSDPVWNFPMKFTVNETAVLKNRMFLVVKIKSRRLFLDKNLGQARVPIKELLEGVESEGKAMQTVSYPVRGRYDEPKGVLSFSYKFGEKTAKASSVYRPRVVRGAGRGYSSSDNTGFGTGFIGGLLINDIVNSSGGGGGCGGGGGGCGGSGGCGCGGGGGGCGGGGGGGGGCAGCS